MRHSLCNTSGQQRIAAAMPRLAPSFLAVTALLMFLFFLPLHAAAFWGASEQSVTPGDDGMIAVSADAVGKNATFYTVKAAGKTVKFFAVRDTRSGVRVAVDACDSCWSAGKGYEQQGDAFLCRLCGMKFHVDRIGLRKGGCNPHPVLYKVEDGMVIIPMSEMEASARLFK